MAEWFVKKDESESELEEDCIGPLRPAELLELVRSGRVTESTQVRKDDSAWFPAEQVGGLFEAAIRPTIYYFCPHCEVRITKPPTMCPKCLKEIRKAREEIIENAIARPEEESVRSQARSVQKWLAKKVRKKEEDS